MLWISFAVIFLISFSGCIQQNTKENAESIAQEFAINLQKSDYESLYDLFIPDLKSMRKKSDFVKYVNIKGSPLDNNYIIFDKVVMQGDNEAYAYYTLSSGIFEAKVPPMHLIFTSEGWRVDAFSDYFSAGCIIDDDCSADYPRCSKNLECVKCVSDADCSDSGKKHCDSVLNICHECIEDYHCPKDKPICYGFSCIECRKNSDCPTETPYCNYVLGSGYVCNNNPTGIECIEDVDCIVLYGTKKMYCNANGKYIRFTHEDECIYCRDESDCPRGKDYCISGEFCV